MPMGRATLSIFVPSRLKMRPTGLGSPGLTTQKRRNSLATAAIRSLEGDDSRFVFAICESHEDTHVGIVSLQHIDYQERTAHLAIMLGDKAYWGKGAAKQALDLAAQFGFSYLNLIRLFAGTYAANTSMNFTLRSLGMMRTDTVRLLADPEAALYVDGFTWAAVQSEWKPLHALVLGEADGSSD
jgi:RimJ/RimL family protein N-acetyltransferase